MHVLYKYLSMKNFTTRETQALLNSVAFTWSVSLYYTLKTKIMKLIKNNLCLYVPKQIPLKYGFRWNYFFSHI